MSKYSYWQSRLIDSIEETMRAQRLRSVFDAGGCREGWIQGEVYLQHRARLCTNWVPIAPRARADLSADLEVGTDKRVHQCGPRPMVAEVKMLSASFQVKTITGGAIRPFRNIPPMTGR